MLDEAQSGGAAFPGVVSTGKDNRAEPGWAGPATLLEPSPDIGHAEVGGALIQRREALVAEQALYIDSFAGGHSNRFIGGFPVARARRRRRILFGQR